MLRRVTIKEGTLRRFGDLTEWTATGWDLHDAVNYGIGHKADTSAVFYLNPGTACNHADSTREASIRYNMDQPGVIELWTIKDVAAGEEMFNDYSHDFKPIQWYDAICKERNLGTPLSALPAMIEAMYQ